MGPTGHRLNPSTLFHPAMKNLFHKIEPSSTYTLGKKEKKQINSLLNKELLDKSHEYKVYKCKNRTSIIVADHAILFFFCNRYWPTIRQVERDDLGYSVVYVDDGAVGPIKRGAGIMAPGVYKYRNMIRQEYKSEDMVVIRHIDGPVLAVGKAIMDYRDINMETSGMCIEIYHAVDDSLHSENFIE